MGLFYRVFVCPVKGNFHRVPLERGHTGRWEVGKIEKLLAGQDLCQFEEVRINGTLLADDLFERAGNYRGTL